MQIRKEYKYLVRNDQLDKFRSRLRPFVNIDKYAQGLPNNEYKVRSVYYDTGQLDYYAEKDAGVKIRKKFRIRGYGDTPENATLFMEVKRKSNEIVWKNRAPLKHQDIKELLFKGNSNKLVMTNDKFPKAVDDANVFLYYMYREYLVPMVLVVYDREPFISKFNNDLRITFDKNIRSKVCNNIDDLFCLHKDSYYLRDYFVLEVKFNYGFPLWLSNIIREFGLVREAVSKYSMSIDYHRPELEKQFRHPSIGYPISNIQNKQIYQKVVAAYDE